MTSRPPTWLDEPCPPWCISEHAEDDHVDDRRHQGTPSFVTLDVASDAVPGAAHDTLDLVVTRDRPVGSDADWVRIESRESRPRIAVATTSITALIGALSEQHRDRPPSDSAGEKES